MRNLLNVISVSFIGGTIVLTGCADRGMGGFKSFKTTPQQRAEIAAERARIAGEVESTETPAGNETTAGTDDTLNPDQLGDGTNQGTDVPTATDQGTQSTETQAAPPAEEVLVEFPNEEAKSQTLTELGQDPSAQGQLLGKLEQVVAVNDADLRAGVNAEAAAAIKGISIFVEGDRSQRLLSIDALVMIGGVEHTLHVAQSELRVLEDGSLTNIPVRLKDAASGQDVAVDGKAVVIGNCTEATCTDIQVRIELAKQSGGKVAAVFLAHLTGEGYAVVDTNIAEQGTKVLTFEEARGGVVASETEASGEVAASETATTEVANTETTTSETTTTATTEETVVDALNTGTAAEADRPADAPALDVGQVDKVVDGDSAGVLAPDAPGVGVVDPNAAANQAAAPIQDTRAEAIADMKATNAWIAQRAAAAGLQRIHDQRETAQMAAQTPAARTTVTAAPGPRVTVDARAEAIAEKKATDAWFAQRRADVLRRARLEAASK